MINICDHHYKEICRILEVDEIEVFPLPPFPLPCIFCGTKREWVTTTSVALRYIEKLCVDGDPDPDKPIVGILSEYRKG